MSLTDEERAAIEAWLAENEPTVYAVGESGIYDEFGRTKSSMHFYYAKLARKIRRLKGYQEMTTNKISRHLDKPEIDIKTTCQKHKIRTKK